MGNVEDSVAYDNEIKRLDRAWSAVIGLDGDKKPLFGIVFARDVYNAVLAI